MRKRIHGSGIRPTGAKGGHTRGKTRSPENSTVDIDIILASLAREKRIAEMLQQSALLDVPVRLLAGYEIASCYEAALDEANVGGDFVDAFLVDEDHLALVVGDIMGKGLAAAVHVAEAKYSIRALLRELRNPALVLERVNCHMCEADAVATQACCDLVCVIVIVLERATGSVDIVVSGMDPPVIVRNTGLVCQADAGGAPLGLARDAKFVAVRSNLNFGEYIFLFTDGITESRLDGRLFGIEGVTNYLRSNCRRAFSLGSIVAGLLDVAKHHGGDRLSDDACLLAVTRDLEQP